jgi:hypothetical protein
MDAEGYGESDRSFLATALTSAFAKTMMRPRYENAKCSEQQPPY